jgi:large subunit ribosomal protein L15
VRGKGFTPISRIEYNRVNLDKLVQFAANSEVNPESLVQARLLRNTRKPVVILGRGDINVALKVRVHRISEGARAKIEKAGGQVELIEWSAAEKG